MNDQITIANPKILAIEVPLRKKYLSEIKKTFDEGSYTLVIPKNFDGSEVIQLFIEITKYVVPAIITYLIATRKEESLQIKFYDEKLGFEIEAALSNKKLKKMQIYEKLDKLLMLSLDNISEEKSNEINN